MAALAMVGTIFMGCSENDLVENTPKGGAVTLTTTISLDSSAGTRALDADGKKTLVKDDQIAILYKDANDKSQKAIVTLKETDISSDGKTAKITVTLNNPKASGQLRCIYPAAMLSGDFSVDLNPEINNENTINYPELINHQDGTLATIASKFDLAVYDGTFTSDAELPSSITLKNQLAIVALNIKDYETAGRALLNFERYVPAVVTVIAFLFRVLSLIYFWRGALFNATEGIKLSSGLPKPPMTLAFVCALSLAFCMLGGIFLSGQSHVVEFRWLTGDDADYTLRSFPLYMAERVFRS